MVNVWVKVWPFAIGAEANELSSAVTVCCVESSNFHVTVVPTATVKVIGVNMKLLIPTVDPAAGAAEPLGATDCAGAGGGAPPLSDPGPQPIASTRLRAT